MTHQDRILRDLDYVASVVRRGGACAGIPAIYFLWAAIIAIGFSLADFAPRHAGPFWLVAGIGGGTLSWFLGARDARRSGISDTAAGRRHGLHWMIGGVAFLLCVLPAATGRVAPDLGVANFLLVAGILYALAGVHLERPLLWSGLLMLAAYVVLVLFSPLYLWTITGLVVAAALLWAGFSVRRQRRAQPRG